MQKEKLTFKHKALLFDRLKEIEYPLSEYSFANLYLFRQIHQYEVIYDKEIFISGLSYDHQNFLMPTICLKDLDFNYLQSIITGFDFLFPVPEQCLPEFDQSVFDCYCKKSDMDYIYDLNKFSTYSGKKLQSKRNLVKQFLSLYEHQELPLTREHMEDARNILYHWQQDHPGKEDETDYYPCLEALNLYDELRLCGGIYYANNEPAGFIIGEELNKEVYVIHFAKGLKKFKGIYQFMYNNFANLLNAHYKFYNFEQDMGKESLRKAKSSYKPLYMLKKYRVRLKK